MDRMDCRIVSLALTFWIVAVCPSICFGHACEKGHDSGTSCPSGPDRSCDDRPCLCATSTAADTSSARGCLMPPQEVCVLASAGLGRQLAPDAAMPEVADAANAVDMPPLLESVRLLI